MNIFKKIFNWLFDKKDAIHPECQKVYDGIEEIKNSYKKINNDVISMSREISDEEFRSLTTEQQKAIVKQELKNYNVEYTNTDTGETIIGEAGKIPTLGHGTYSAKTIIPEAKLDIVTSGYLRREDDPFPEKGILTTSSTSDKVMNVDVSKNPPKITFFDPEDNKKETVLNEKKASEIKKKRQYKKKKK